jgi:hypothetical protein
MITRYVLKALGAIVLLASLAGCAVTADLTRNSVRPPTLMVATPIPRTLYIVMTPDNVADAFPIRNSAHSVVSFRAFFGDTLRRTMQPYFSAVEVVAAAPASPPGAAVIADVRVDGVEARDLPIGSLIYTTLHLQWAFAIRPAEDTEYAFTFAGEGVSDHAYRTLGEGFEQMTLSAVGGLMEGWTENDVFALLRGAPATAADGSSTGP